MKKQLALVLALVLVLSLSVSASAAYGSYGPNSICRSSSTSSSISTPVPTPDSISIASSDDILSLTASTVFNALKQGEQVANESSSDGTYLAAVFTMKHTDRGCVDFYVTVNRPVVEAEPEPTLKSTPTSTPSASSNSSGSKSTSTNSPSSNSTFTNQYGTSTTKCAHPGCNNYIASSGDTAYCTKHSNKCLNCGKYIDGFPLKDEMNLYHFSENMLRNQTSMEED